MPAPADIATRFNWPRFNILVALAVMAQMAVAAVMYLAAHQFLSYLVAKNYLTGYGGAPMEVGAARWITRWISSMLVTFDPAWMTWAILLGGSLVCGLIVMQRASRLRTLGGEGIADMLGARLADSDTRGPTVALLESVEAAAAARGIAAPQLYVLDMPDAVTAATLGSTAEDAVIAVTSGALTRLDPVALGALAAWQLMALDSGRVERDAGIAAALHPLTLTWMLGDRLVDLEVWINERYDAYNEAVESTAAGKLGNFPVPMYYSLVSSLNFVIRTLRQMVRVAGFPGLAMARLLVQSSVRADFDARDSEIAAQATHRDALAAVLDAGARTDDPDGDQWSELVRAQPFAVEFAQAFFAEPAAVPQGARMRKIAQYLASHRDPGGRIARIAPVFDRAAYERATTASAVSGAIPEFARNAAPLVIGGLAISAARGPVVAPRAPPALPGYQFPDPTEEIACGEFFLRFGRALLVLFDTPQGGSQVILAANFVPVEGEVAARALAGRLKDVSLDTLAGVQRTLGKLNARERRWLIERALGPLLHAPQPLKSAHLDNQRALIEADRRITLNELLDWLMVSRALGMMATVAPVAAPPQGMLLLIAVLSHAGAGDAKAAAHAFASGCAAVEIAGAALPGREQLNAAAIEQALLRLARSDHSQRTLAIKACLAAARANGPLSEDREELLRRLCAILDCPVSMLLPAVAIHTQESRVAAELPAASGPATAAAVTATDGGSVRVPVGCANGLPLAQPCQRCQGSMHLRRRTSSASTLLADWFLPGVAALVVGAFLAFLCSDMHCGPVGWTAVIAISAATMLGSAMILGTQAGFEVSRKTQIRVLCGFFLLGIAGNLYMRVDFGVWVAEFVTFGGFLTYLLQSKPSGRNLFYQCSQCGASSLPSASLVSTP